MSTRTEDLIRRFLLEMGPVIANDRSRRQEERVRSRALQKEERADAREDRELSLREALLQEKRVDDLRADVRRDTEDARRARREMQEEEDRRLERERQEASEKRAQAAERRAEERHRERGSSRRDPDRVTPARQMSSARGDVQRWIGRGKGVTRESARKYLGDLYQGDLTPGEISRVVEEEFRKVESARRSGRRGRPPTDEDRVR